MADFTTARLVKSLNLQYTYMNALTSLGLLPAKIPIYFDNDCAAIEAALASLASDQPEKLRVVRIADTLNLERMQASEASVRALNGRPGVTIAGAAPGSAIRWGRKLAAPVAAFLNLIADTQSPSPAHRQRSTWGAGL